MLRRITQFSISKENVLGKSTNCVCEAPFPHEIPNAVTVAEWMGVEAGKGGEVHKCVGVFEEMGKAKLMSKNSR